MRHLALVALLALCVPVQIAYSTRSGECWETGEQSQGAPGYPAVEWKPCCDGRARQVEVSGKSGKYCVVDGDGVDCYETGERSQGSYGYPALEWKPCCDGRAKQVEKQGEWGKFCLLEDTGGDEIVGTEDASPESSAVNDEAEPSPEESVTYEEEAEASFEVDVEDEMYPEASTETEEEGSVTGKGPFPDFSFKELTFIAPGTVENGSTSTLSTDSSGDVYVFDYEFKVNDGGIVSLSDASTVITSVQCTKGGEVRVQINPEFNPQQSLEEMYPLGAIMSIDADIYGECNLILDESNVEAEANDEKASGYLFISKVNGTVFDAQISGFPAAYFNLFEEADMLLQRQKSTELGPAVVRQSGNTIVNQALEIEFGIFQAGLGMTVQDYGNFEFLKAKWDPVMGLDIECKLTVEYVVTFEAAVSVSVGVQPRGNIYNLLSVPLYGIPSVPLPKIKGISLKDLKFGLYFELPIIGGGGIELSQELPIPLKATVNSGRKEVIVFARGSFSDPDTFTTGVDVLVDNPLTGEFTVPTLDEAILAFESSLAEKSVQLYFGVQPRVALRCVILQAKLSVDVGAEIESRQTLSGAAYPPDLTGSFGYCETCHYTKLSGKGVADKFGLSSKLVFVPKTGWGASLREILSAFSTRLLRALTSVTLFEVSLPVNFVFANDIFTACFDREFAENTEVCGTGPNAICCDSSVPDQSCNILPQPQCTESPSPSPTPDEDNFAASVITDPHLRTFDGLMFDCQASGEFILARSLSPGLMVQGRFSGPSTSGSVLKAIAIKEGDSPTLQVSVDTGNGTSTCPLRLTVDGVERSFETASFGGDGSLSLEVGSGSRPLVQVSTASGCVTEFKPRFSQTFGCYLESFSLSVPSSLAPGITGLLGTPNDDIADDWQDQNGTVLSTPDTLSNRLYEAAYNYCTTNWCITDPGASIFAYEEGKSHIDFALCDKPYVRPDVESASPELVALCGGSVECLIDGVVGSEEDAQAGLDALAAIESRFNNTVNESITEVTLPSDLSNLTLHFIFYWEAKGDLDTSATWLGNTVGYGCDASVAEFIAWSQDDTSATGSETYDIDLNGSLAANAWNGSTEVQFGAGWYSVSESLGNAKIRVSLQTQDGSDVPGTVLETDVNPGTQDGCANEVIVAVARLTESEGGEGVTLEMTGV